MNVWIAIKFRRAFSDVRLYFAVAILSVVFAGCVEAESRGAVATSEFLDSIGVGITTPDRGQPLDKTISMIRYCGFRWIRGGIEGMSEDGPTTLNTFLELHRATGVMFSWGLGSGSNDIAKLIETGREVAKAGALLAFEGNNEPNNWSVTYKGNKGGGSLSWLPVAMLQRDLYQAVKSDEDLANYPVWSISEPGAQTDNVGLQYLQIPQGADLLMPDGTKYADFANVHNYIYHPRSPKPRDNKVWNAADPTETSDVDGLFGNFGNTWGKQFKGYEHEELESLPRVTTETGVAIGGAITEWLHGVNLMNMYLAQFKRGYSYTAVYLLRDRTDEGGNQRFGFFDPDYKPRRAAHFLHNLTTILSDDGELAVPGILEFQIKNQPETVHELLLQRSDGVFMLVMWAERLHGKDRVTLRLGQPARSIEIFDPTVGKEPLQILKDVESVDLTFRDHPLILAITPFE